MSKDQGGFSCLVHAVTLGIVTPAEADQDMVTARRIGDDLGLMTAPVQPHEPSSESIARNLVATRGLVFNQLAK